MQGDGYAESLPESDGPDDETEEEARQRYEEYDEAMNSRTVLQPEPMEFKPPQDRMLPVELESDVSELEENLHDYDFRTEIMKLVGDIEDVGSDPEDRKAPTVVQPEPMEFEQLPNRVRPVDLSRDVEVGSDPEDRQAPTVFHPELMECEPLADPIRPVDPERDAEDVKSNPEDRKAGKCPREWTVVDLRKEHGKLQVIVKLANIHLTPEKPSYGGGTWHVEGQLNENM